jgi:hypothetical protein
MLTFISLRHTDGWEDDEFDSFTCVEHGGFWLIFQGILLLADAALLDDLLLAFNSRVRD